MKTALAIRALTLPGLRRLAGALAPWSGVLSVNYHRVGDAAGSLFDHGLWSATADGFDRQLAILKTHADVISPGDLPAARATARGRFVIVTFDDGYRDNFDLAYPILRRHGLAATFFITTGFLDRRPLAWWDEIAWMVRSSPKRGIDAGRWLAAPLVFDEPLREQAVRVLLRTYKAMDGSLTAAYLDDLAAATGSGRWPSGADAGMWMTWDMVREMRAGGMVIGGHTMSHPVLARMRPDEQWEEIDGCRRRLADELGQPMACFSYPVGSRQAFDARTRACLDRAGVQHAFSYYGGINRFGAWDDLDLRRVAIESHMDSAWVEAILTLPGVFGREH